MRRPRRRRRRQRDRHGEGGLGAGRAPRALGSDDVLGRGVDARLRHARRGDAARSGGGSRRRTAGILYDEGLTLTLPRGESGGTALNALAHCAEALYVAGRNPDADREALAGAALIGTALPLCPRGRNGPGRAPGAARGRDARGRRARRGRARSRARARAGAGRALRHFARRGERALPSAGASLQPAGRRRRRSPGSPRRSARRTRQGGPRSWRGSPASPACATSGCAPRTWTRPPPARSSGPAHGPTRARSRRPRPRSCCCPSGRRLAANL